MDTKVLDIAYAHTWVSSKLSYHVRAKIQGSPMSSLRGQPH